MTTEAIQKLYNATVEEISLALAHGERILPSLFAVLEERKKQLDLCLESFNNANSKLSLAKVKTGQESVDSYYSYQCAEGYLKALTSALQSYSLAFADAHAIANSTGTLRERLALFLANAKTPELIVGHGAASAALDFSSILKKKPFDEGN